MTSSLPSSPLQRHLVINFNSPELNHLALGLARSGALAGYVRPYVNKGRRWELGLERLPMASRIYASTFGRRRLLDPCLGEFTFEAGILADLLAAAVGRTPILPRMVRSRWTNELYMKVRDSVALEGRRRASDVQTVVAYEGFALPAFERMQRAGMGRAVLNYPVAHHRHRRRYRLEENAREPDFAVTWPDFDDWPEGHEERLDEEIRLADVVLLGSGYARDTFAKQGVDPGKVAVVPYGVDLTVFHPQPVPMRTRGLKAIYAGQLTQRKGLSYLLRGWERFCRPGATLTLVGSLVGGTAPLTPFAHMFRHVSHRTRPQLAAMYRESDVFVFPTLVEGMPLVVLEAMACGLPVIVTANGPGDIVRDGIDGFVIPERDADAICDCLERLHRDPDLRVQMGRNAAARALEYSWEAYARSAMAAIAAAPAG